MHINQYPMIGLSKSGQNCSSALSRRPDAGWAGGDICLNGAYTPAQQPKAHPVQRPGDAESAADATREDLRGTRKALRQTAAAVGAAAVLIHELTRWPVGRCRAVCCCQRGAEVWVPKQIRQKGGKRSSDV